MEPNHLDTGRIHPRYGARYSPNLHRFMSARSRRVTSGYAHVYRDREGTLWLGYLDDGFMNGTRLMSVLCEGGRAQTMAYGGLGPLTLVHDFWTRYLAIGRCAIDPDHRIGFIGDQTRWQTDGDVRSCLWCGQATQKLDRWVERVQRERWCNIEEPAV
jgi:hypothetical protein